MSDSPQSWRVSLKDLRRERFGDGGWPSWGIPVQGGRIKYDDIVVEILPEVEWEEGSWQWREYEALESLVAQAEKQGGWIWSNRDIHVGDEILVGKDVIEFLSIAVRRANQRSKGGGQYAQGYNDALRDIRAKLDAAMQSIPKKYTD